ncbi:MAG: hypothetical protein ACT4PL_02545, partial [Phycisphaerales bacterium]
MTAHNHSESAAVAMPPVLHGGDATPTQIIRAAAGAPAVVQRRGTVLVLVIGVLALMAIVVVVYTTLGQADRRASAALVRQTRIDDQGSAIAGYIAGVIGKDRLKGSFEYDSAYRGTNAAGVVVAGGSQPRFIRAHTTAPSILPLALSVDPSRQTAAGQTPTTGSAALAPDLWPLLLFSNDGSVTRPWRDANTAGNLRIDPRYATTPWLASSEPTWLDQTNQGVGLLGNEPWLQMRDWASLSNIAPSGNPVNLVNLRGNFAAESGLGASGPGAFRMTSNLWIYNAAGTPVRVIPGTTTLADLNFPAHWFANQARSFRSILDGTFVAGDSRAVGNMFADADGDGFADSRWVELVDISDPVAPRSVLPVAGPARLFVGCRIVDLSGKVNVNTATQFRTAPTLFEPAGNTPADVDLERLLTAIDFLPPLSGNAALTYDALRQPAQPYSQGAANSAAGNYENPNAYGAVAFEVGGSGCAGGQEAKIQGVTQQQRATQHPSPDNPPRRPKQTH